MEYINWGTWPILAHHTTIFSSPLSFLASVHHQRLAVVYPHEFEYRNPKLAKLTVYSSTDCCLPSVRPFDMPFSHFKRSAPSISGNIVPSTSASSRCAHVLDFAQVQPRTAQLNCRISLVKNVPTLKIVSSKGPPTCKGLHLSMEGASQVSGCQEQGLGVNHSDVETEVKVTALDSWSNSQESSVVNDQQHVERISNGLITKRNVPWNKGRKHNAETRERISYRTKEALRDPKVKSCKNLSAYISDTILQVRMKMSTRARPPLSKRTRARIGASQARLWDERLKWKRSREKFFALWSDSIAKAAKRGGRGQDKLDWDSFEKLKREIVSEQLQLDADRAKAKLLKKLLAKERAEEKARVKAEKMEKLAQKRKDDAERLKLNGKIARKQRSKEEIEELAVARVLKLKERLTKIHKQKSRGRLVTGQNPNAWDSLDLESLEKKGNNASLADQIQAIRSKRVERVGRNETQMASYAVRRSKLAQLQLVENEMEIV